MDDLLLPDTPACQRSNDTPTEEASCCSPIRSKLNTTPIKLLSMMYILCGVLSIGLGVVACIFGCLYNGVSIPAGVMFIATGVVGMCVRKHGSMNIVYGFLSMFCFLSGTAVLVFMFIALPERESGDSEMTCGTHDCYDPYDRYSYIDNCCPHWVQTLKWENVAIDLAILVVGVIAMVNSLLATTLSLRNVNWIKVCCLKKNMEEQPCSVQTSAVTSSDERSVASDQSPAAMKRCWKPCDSNDHHTATIVLSVIHIIIGLISVGLGVAAVFVGCRFAHMGIPIWTGILIFVVTGINGLLSASKKGSYIPCFFALSFLAFFLSINMFSWAAVNIGEEEECKFGCVEWGCNGTVKPTPSYGPECYRCLPDCCYNGDVCDHEQETIRIIVDAFIIGFGVLEMMICMVTFGLSCSQLSCYFCCRNMDCSPVCCCQYNTNGQYKMVMTSDGNLMMVPVPNAQHGLSTMVHNQPVMMQQPMVIQPNQLIGGQNQGSPAMASQTTGAGELSTQQPVIGHPKLLQGHGQLMMAQGQGQPMMGQPMMVQGQGQPMLGQGQPMLVQGQPMLVQGQPMLGQGQPMLVQGQPMMVQGQGQPLLVLVQGQQGVGQPMCIQQPMVQGMGQVAMVQGQEQPADITTEATLPQATGEGAIGGDQTAQEVGSVSNPVV